MTYKDAMIRQHERNIAQLEANAKQIKKNQRWLHWWNPFREFLQGPHEDLLREDAHLRDVDQKMMKMMGAA